MGCSPSGYKSFLVCSNVALLFIGLSILIFGMKMRVLLEVVLLIDVPIIAQAVDAVVATGSVISMAGLTGISGACYEALWLITVHLVSLGIIVIMEFGLGVTLLVVKRAVENYIGSVDCNKNCATTLDTLVLDYALPSAGLMMSIIIVEAVMIYCAVKLYFYIRDAPKIPPPINQTFTIQNVQMRDVASPLPAYAMSPNSSELFSTPQMSFMQRQAPLGFLCHTAPPEYTLRSPQPYLYSTMSLDQQPPPSYVEVLRTPKPEETARPAPLNSV